MTAMAFIVLGGESGLAAVLVGLGTAWARKHWIPALAETAGNDADSGVPAANR